MFTEFKLRNYNLKLIGLVLVLCSIGTIIIYSADNSYLRKELFGVLICIAAMIIISIIDYHWICKFYIPLYILNLVMLLLVKFAGEEVNGAKRWFEIIPGTLSIQPSEFAKLILIIFVTVLIIKFDEKLNNWKSLLLLAVSLAIPLFLIKKQPDLSTTLDIVFIMCILIYVGGLSYKLIGFVALAMVPIVGSLLWYIQLPNQKLISDNQKGRVLAFLYPNEYSTTTGYQQDNSVMAIGSGMLHGKGLFSSDVATVKDANFVSEQQTDFIFSVVGEELGFIGSVIIIAIIALLVLECIHVARQASDREGMLIASGIAAYIGVQTFINIGVATQLLPNTGIPLPFISYGLCSLLCACSGVGMVINISMQKKKY